MRPRRAALLQPRVAKQAKWEGKTTLRQSCGCAVFLKEYARYAPHLASFAFNCSHHARGNVTGWDYGTSCQSNLEPTWTNTFTLRRTKARWGALCYQIAYAPKQLRGSSSSGKGGIRRMSSRSCLIEEAAVQPIFDGLLKIRAPAQVPAP